MRGAISATIARRPIVRSRPVRQASRRAAFVETALLVNADIGRNDPPHVEMIVDPRDNAIRAGRPRRLGINRIGDADGAGRRAAAHQASPPEQA
jgi:hypothetical protein